MGVMCSTSQCELRSTFPNLRVTNVIRIVTFYTLPPLESPTSSWVTRSQRSRRRDKGLLCIIYNALILPQLNYGILAWGHLAKRLNLIQKRAVRILTASKYNSHTEPLFKQTNIKVTDICTLNEIKFYYKLINKQLPQYFNSFTCEANSDIHGYNTRTRNKLHTLKTNHDFAQKSLRYTIIQTINKLPDNVTGKMRTHSIYGLTNYAKKYFISNYKTECTIENCYTCQCSMR